MDNDFFILMLLCLFFDLRVNIWWFLCKVQSR